MAFVIDASGFRQNIGIILTNPRGQVFWGKRVGKEAWQFPQGGMHADETPEATLFRELKEEIGLEESSVSILNRTNHWLRYRIPQRLIRKTEPKCIGQKQLWYLLRLEAEDSLIQLDSSEKPEFDEWKWVSYWYPLREIVLFKREVYRRALKELAPFLFRHSTRGFDLHTLDSLLSDHSIDF